MKNAIQDRAVPISRQRGAEIHHYGKIARLPNGLDEQVCAFERGESESDNVAVAASLSGANGTQWCSKLCRHAGDAQIV